MGRFNMTYVDYGGEVSTAGFPTADITAANADTIYANSLTLQNAVEAVVLGLLTKVSNLAKTSPQAVGKSDNELAQRETKALVRYYDDTTFVRASLEIPCVDLSLQHPSYPEIFYRNGVSGHEAVWGTFVTAFEALVPGPSGNAAVIDDIIFVGRNT